MTPRMLTRLLPACLLVAGLSSAVSFGQAPTVSLRGTVTDAETGDPLPGAHVFIASSMMGTVTANDGTYELERVPIGAIRLYVSMIGFEPEGRDIMLRTTETQTFDFAMQPSVIEVGEIVVEAKGDKKWKERLEKFTTLFIGETPNAHETVITNPEVLDFESKGGEFRAIAAEPLIIENKALGYRIQYFLKDFVAEPMRTRYDGEPLFEEMEPSDSEEAARWEEKRRLSFIGSFRHFMLALLANKVEEQGFLTYGRTTMAESASTGSIPGSPTAGSRFPLNAQEILRPASTPNEKTVDFEGFVEITFRGEVEDKSYLEWSGRGRHSPKFQTSWISLERGPTLVDYKGDILDPYGVTFYGYLAFERVADEVPKEYRP